MSIFTKIVFFRGSAPDPAGGALDAPPDPLVEFVRRLALQTGSLRRSLPIHYVWKSNIDM